MLLTFVLNERYSSSGFFIHIMSVIERCIQYLTEFLYQTVVKFVQTNYPLSYNYLKAYCLSRHVYAHLYAHTCKLIRTYMQTHTYAHTCTLMYNLLYIELGSYRNYIQGNCILLRILLSVNYLTDLPIN